MENGAESGIQTRAHRVETYRSIPELPRRFYFRMYYLYQNRKEYNRHDWEN